MARNPLPHKDMLEIMVEHYSQAIHWFHGRKQITGKTRSLDYVLPTSPILEMALLGLPSYPPPTDSLGKPESSCDHTDCPNILANFDDNTHEPPL